jgi:GLPGLI family protein
MKMKNILIALSLLISTVGFSQLSGEVYYTTTVNLHKRIPDTERGKRMKEFMPETVGVQNMLIFSPTESVYKNIEDTAAVSMEEEEGGRHMKMMKKYMAPPNDIVYTNTETGEVVEKKDFMDKIFLIQDSIVLSQWKLSGEMKEVSGMNCMRADFIPDDTDTNEMYVWFTPEITVSSGPAGYGGLPGLIVYLNQNDGEKIISMTTIVMREVAEDEIEKPKKGKKVTREEFQEIQHKKMLEQKKNWEGGKGGRH